jgi:hypothetical protein
MTLTQLLELPADDLEKLSDKELDAICAPYWNVTRPDLAKVKVVEESRPKPKKLEDSEKMAKLKQAEALARQMGLNLKLR